MSYQQQDRLALHQVQPGQLLAYAPIGRTVRIGRYKDQAYQEMLLDTPYCRWALSNSIFKERDPETHDALVKFFQDSETPLHNKRQAELLMPEFRIAFINVVDPGFEAAIRKRFMEKLTSIRDKARARMDECRQASSPEKLEEATEEYRRLKQLTSELARSFWIETTTTQRFERKSIDAEIISCSEIKYPDYIDNNQLPKTLRNPREYAVFAIEIKPWVGEDWPAVLRQMYSNNSKYLLIDSYTGTGEGATEDQFRDIFFSSGKVVIFRADVDAEYQHLLGKSYQKVDYERDLQAILD